MIHDKISVVFENKYVIGCMGASALIILYWILYRIKRIFDKRCPVCHTLKTHRRHSIRNMDGGEVLRFDAGFYETLSLAWCDKGDVWVYRSGRRYFTRSELWWRFVMPWHWGEFRPHDQEMLIKAGVMIRPNSSSVVVKHKPPILCLHPSDPNPLRENDHRWSKTHNGK